jgi:hypothetical protein
MAMVYEEAAKAHLKHVPGKKAGDYNTHVFKLASQDAVDPEVGQLQVPQAETDEITAAFSRFRQVVVRCKRIIQFSILILPWIFTQFPAFAVTPPVISPGSGTFSTSQSVTISAASGQIYYTLNGSQPSNLSTHYSAAFTVASPTQINAVAYDSSTSTYSTITTAYLDVDAALSSILQTGLILRLRAGLGVSTATINPNPVLVWSDLSNSSPANDATSSTDHEPAFLNSVVQGPAISFNGNSQFLALPSGFADFTGGATVFAVMQPLSSAIAPIIDLGQAGSGNDVLLQIGTTSGIAQVGTFSGTSGTFADSAQPLQRGVFQLVEGVVIPGSTVGSGTVIVDSFPGTSNAAMNNVPNVTRDTNFIGRFSSGIGNEYHGNIAELLMYKTHLSDAQRAAIRLYLTKKYLLGSLPVAAPVFSIASGELAGPSRIAIAPALDCGITRYTTDGSVPTLASPQYNEPLLITYTQTIRAVNVVDGIASAVASATYTLNSTNWPAPSPSDTSTLDFELRLPTNAILQP